MGKDGFGMTNIADFSVFVVFRFMQVWVKINNFLILHMLFPDPPLNDLQKAEEMIKREMILMMHHDCLETPTLAQQGAAGAKYVDKTVNLEINFGCSGTRIVRGEL